MSHAVGRWPIRHPVIGSIALSRLSLGRYAPRVFHRFLFPGFSIRDRGAGLSGAGRTLFRILNLTELPHDIRWQRKPGEDQSEIEGSASSLPFFIDRKLEVSVT